MSCPKCEERRVKALTEEGHTYECAVSQVWADAECICGAALVSKEAKA